MITKPWTGRRSVARGNQTTRAQRAASQGDDSQRSVLALIRSAVQKQASLTIVVATILLGIYLGFATENFLTAENLLEVARQSSLLGVMSIGLTLVIIGGQIDLSMGSVYGLAAVVTAMTINASGDVLSGCAAGVLVGVIAGIVNGTLSATFGLPAFIVTFGTLSIMRGLALSITDAQPQALFGSDARGIEAFEAFGQGEIFGISYQVILLLVVAVLAYLLLNRTKFGLRLYATGGSRLAAEYAGIRSSRVQVTAFVASGFLAAVAGISALAFLGSAAPTAGTGLEFDVFAAAILGGASLYGGVGTIQGAVAGALFLGVLRNGLVLMGVSSFTQQVIVGLIAIGAVGLNRLVIGKTT